MALSFNCRSLFRRLVLSDFRTTTRFYSEQQEGSNIDQKEIDPTKDRTKIVPVETSIKYMQSKAYQQTYGESAVWVLYRRNHKGGFAPRKTRKSCVRNGVISTGNPCPICRDEYLVLDHRNTKLLEQFISEYTGQFQYVCVHGSVNIKALFCIAKCCHTDVSVRYPGKMLCFREILDAFKTGLCQKKHKELLVAIERAWDHGHLTYDVPFREYDYTIYNKNANSV